MELMPSFFRHMIVLPSDCFIHAKSDTNLAEQSLLRLKYHEWSGFYIPPSCFHFVANLLLYAFFSLELISYLAISRRLMMPAVHVVVGSDKIRAYLKGFIIIGSNCCFRHLNEQSHRILVQADLCYSINLK